MVYLQASIKLKPGKLADFTSLLNKIAPVLAKRGMKLLGSYANVVGRLNTVVDLWELTDANALQAALSDPELQKMAPLISEIIEDETQVLLAKLPIG
jgi:quinol monooxygenase YgiN